MEQTIYPEEYKRNTINRVSKIAECNECKNFNRDYCGADSPLYPDSAHTCVFFEALK